MCSGRVPSFCSTNCTHRVTQELLTIREHLGLHPVFGGVVAAHLFSFLCCGFCLVCLRPVSCTPNVASVSGLSILDYSFGFL
jgi:hypothetical protein